MYIPFSRARSAQASKGPAPSSIDHVQLEPRPTGHTPFNRYELSLHLLFNFSISLHTASVTPAVPSFPPKSLVKIPASHTLSTHRIIMSAASSSPTHRNISAADQKAATGFATPLPVMSNAL